MDLVYLSAMKKKQPATVNVHAAKTHFSKLLAKVASGEEVVIAHAGTPVARLIPYTRTTKSAGREFGRYDGKVWIAPDFNAPDTEIEKLFHRGSE
jgi:prevent-host-death family protein